jgi:hypothetical protein
LPTSALKEAKITFFKEESLGKEKDVERAMREKMGSS